jgi:hypothetical protein
MGHARAWTAWGVLLPGQLVALQVPGAQAPAKTTPGVRQQGFLGQFTSREQWQMPVRVMDESDVVGLPLAGLSHNESAWRLCFAPPHLLAFPSGMRFLLML